MGSQEEPAASIRTATSGAVSRSASTRAGELGGELSPKGSGGFGFEDLVEPATVECSEIGGGRLFGDDPLVGVFEVILLRFPGGAGAPVHVAAEGGKLNRGVGGGGVVEVGEDDPLVDQVGHPPQR
nr:hypothetical protein [Rhodococcus wratislaviensis]